MRKIVRMRACVCKDKHDARKCLCALHVGKCTQVNMLGMLTDVWIRASARTPHAHTCVHP